MASRHQHVSDKGNNQCPPQPIAVSAPGLAGIVEFRQRLKIGPPSRANGPTIISLRPAGSTESSPLPHNIFTIARSRKYGYHLNMQPALLTFHFLTLPLIRPHLLPYWETGVYWVDQECQHSRDRRCQALSWIWCIPTHWVSRALGSITGLTNSHLGRWRDRQRETFIIIDLVYLGAELQVFSLAGISSTFQRPRTFLGESTLAPRSTALNINRARLRTYSNDTFREPARPTSSWCVNLWRD